MTLFRKIEERQLPFSIDPTGVTARPMYGSSAGEVVTQDTAFTSTAIMSAITLLADSVAMMPLYPYKEVGSRLERLPMPLVLRKPNAEQTMFDFVHQTIATLAVHGTVFIYAPREGGQLIEMRNIHPDRVAITLDENGERQYEIIGSKEVYSSDVIKQIDWLRFPNQSRGVSPLESLRQTIGTSLAIDRFLAQFYGDGATPSSVLETDNNLSPEAAEVLRNTWFDTHYKSRKPAVLTGGLKWRSVTVSASDMDTINHREAIVRDIARAYRIPLHMINGSGGDSQTYQNVESAGINFLRHTLMPYCKRLEDCISELLPPQEKVRFDTNEIARADQLTRVRAQQTMIMSGTLTPNEARQIEGREPYEGGDQFILGIAGAPVAGVEGGDLPTLGTDGQTAI
ncbi:COG4695 Phage-related protein [uncultured Caudovirales phage]|uniref:COG4695 Phage-related protein n=1 Tax=uncultured Caudovirales phage TaxID=2100421 RepID=A0A6J5LP18_9CAUD|nr:COG4695 Phage-related protein [uncultured Caudovirales phage]CAB4191540.1 COG4695 Phage-related protein [uncultured Caudovirales phage]